MYEESDTLWFIGEVQLVGNANTYTLDTQNNEMKCGVAEGWPVVGEDADGRRVAGTVGQVQSLDLTHHV